MAEPSGIKSFLEIKSAQCDRVIGLDASDLQISRTQFNPDRSRVEEQELLKSDAAE